MSVAGTLEFGAKKAIAVSSFKAFTDAQVQTDITNQSLQNTLDTMSKGALSKLQSELGGTKNAFAGVANAAIEAGNAAVKMSFDDETASRSFAKLFGITKNVAQANKELQIAMDLARFKGISLEEATQKLIMVHSGATKELKMLGIAVEEGASAMKNLDSIQKQVAGSAETFANSAQGGMERLKVQTDNLKEAIGGALAPAFEKILSALTPVIDKFSAWAEKNPELLAKIIMVAGAIAGLVAVIGTLGVVLPPIIAGFTILLGPVGLILLAIGALAFAVYEIITNWTQIVAFFQGIWETLKNNFMGGIAVIRDAIKGFLDGVKKIWTEVWTWVSGFFKSIWDGMTTTAKNAIQAVKDWLQPIIDLIQKVMNGLSAIGKAVGKSVSSAVNWVGDKLGINDGIVQNGKIITTHPDDYIMAMKDPSAVMGGGIVVHLNGGTYLSESVALDIGDMIIDKLRKELRI